MRKPAAAAFVSIDALILDWLLDFVLSYEQLTRLIECVCYLSARTSDITASAAARLPPPTLGFTDTSRESRLA